MILGGTDSFEVVVFTELSGTRETVMEANMTTPAKRQSQMIIFMLSGAFLKKVKVIVERLINMRARIPREL